MKKIVLLMFSLVIVVSAQTELSLSKAIETGLENNYQIKIIKKYEEIADENNTWGRAGRYPSLNLGFSSTNRYDDNSAGETETYRLTPSASLNWVLFDGFAIFHQKSKFEELYTKSKGNTAIVIENTIQAIILAYYNVLLESERLGIFEEVLSLSKDRYDRTLTAKELGSSVTYDVLQAKTAWLEDRSNYLSQKMLFNNSVRSLNLLMGEPENNTYILMDKLNIPKSEYALDELKSKMLENNKTLKNQYLNEILQKREIDISRSDLYPSVSLSAGYDDVTTRSKVNSSPTVKSSSYDYYANLSLSFNLFNGSNTSTNIEIAKIQQDISKIETDEMKHSLSNRLSQYLELFDVQKTLLEVSNENVEAAKLNLQISKEKFEAGNINSFNYRDIQLFYLNAALQKLLSQFNLINTDTELLRLTGGIVTEK
ncbi:MAG: TolC family protein [Melioribacteraceae bacterium]|nr:TolC family protein [Melioribacteraceae bacterium]